MVVAQLAEWSHPIPEDPGSTPAIANFYWTYLLLTICWKGENKRKTGCKCPIKNNILFCQKCFEHCCCCCYLIFVGIIRAMLESVAPELLMDADRAVSAVPHDRLGANFFRRVTNEIWEVRTSGLIKTAASRSVAPRTLAWIFSVAPVTRNETILHWKVGGNHWHLNVNKTTVIMTVWIAEKYK